MSSGLAEVRPLIEHRGSHPVVSLYLDLDPERFATPPARASQIRSLIDQAQRDVEGRQGLGHEDKISLREDLARIDDFLSSPGAPFKGARALAVFCSGRDDLFEVRQLPRPVEGRVVIASHPYVEPLIAVGQQRRWLVALVNRRTGRLLAGSPESLSEQERLEDNVHGQHDQGGWSQANYERSADKDAEDHLRAVAEVVARRWRGERFDRVAVGGPHEVVAHFVELLPQELRERLVPGRLEIDLSSAAEAQVREAVEKLVLEDERRTEAQALERLSDGLGTGRGAVAGVADTIGALNERRVQTLLLAPDFGGAASRCPTCGLLVVPPHGQCPADGSPLESTGDLREAVVEAAIAQDAELLAIRHHPEQAPRGGVGALLRF